MKKAISLFAGAGGLDLGIEDVGFTCVVANELDPYACKTLLTNQELARMDPERFDAWFDGTIAERRYQKIPASQVRAFRERIRPAVGRRLALSGARIIQGDIRSLGCDVLLSAAKAKVGEISLLAGGPPCQPFSRAGKRETVNVEDGRLFLEFVRVVAGVRPRWFIFENVKGLLLSVTDVVRAACQHCARQWIPPFGIRHLSDTITALGCPKCGSNSLRLSTNPSAGGSLDLMLAEFERIGYTCRWTVLNAANFGAPQLRERLFIVGSRDNEQFHWPTDTHGRVVDAQAGLFDGGGELKSWIPMAKVWDGGHFRFGQLDLDKARLWVKNVVRPHDEPVTWDLRRPSPTIGAHQGAKLAIAPDGVPEAQLRRQQWHVLGRRQGDLPPVPVVHEYLTDWELSQLQTFPPHWFFVGTRMERAFQIGNAVPFVLAKAVAQAVMDAITRGDCEREQLHDLDRIHAEPAERCSPSAG